jgi:adenine-specific DNA-methyltransferase
MEVKLKSKQRMPGPKRNPDSHINVARDVPDLISEDIEKLRAVFPQVFSEGKVDLEKLRATLGDIVETRPERFTFSWAGKRNSIQILQMPTRATFVPVKEESIAFDASENLFIEGENLEVLKLLYEPYFGQVKMIYIDPPYNTGSDFVYSDNYADPLETYLKISGQKSAEGNLLTTNPETSGRFHSAWLSMMYPRLFLAKHLLKDEGVIFVSIDDNELANLRLIMNEIFGEENFLAELVWDLGTGTAAGHFTRAH